MKTLITGISGLLGSAVAKEAYSAGYEILGVSRREITDVFDFQIQLIQKDLTHEKLTLQDLQDVKAVIHCAADTTMGALPNEQQNHTNITAVEHLIDVSVEAGIDRFIFVSTANTLYPGTREKPGTERIKLKAKTKRLNYINSKIAAEEMISSAVHQKGLNAVIVNPTFILNPSYKLSNSNQLVGYTATNKVLFYPSGSKNIVDARDVASAIISAIKRGRKGHNYLLSNSNMSYLECQRCIKKHQKANAWFFPIPAVWLLFLATVATFIEYIFNRPQQLNLKSVAHLNSDYFYSNQKAKLELGFKPRPIDDTLSDFFRKM
jgi:dihydroflavonol-4-reductase